MDSDQWFRPILLAWALLTFPIGFYLRVRHSSREKLDRRQEGLFILFTLRPAGLAAAIGFVAYLVNPGSMRWAEVALPIWLRWVGAGLSFWAGFLLIWTLHTLGKNATDTVVVRKNHSLVVTGPYRWARHPLYTATALAVLGVSLAAASAYILAAGSVVFALLVIRCRKEEANLIVRFGDAYRDYMRTTPRFIPSIGVHRRR